MDENLSKMVERLLTSIDRLEAATSDLNMTIAVQKLQVEQLTSDIKTIGAKVESIGTYNYRMEQLEKKVEEMDKSVTTLNRWRWGVVGILLLLSVFMESYGKKLLEVFLH